MEMRSSIPISGSFRPLTRLAVTLLLLSHLKHRVAGGSLFLRGQGSPLAGGARANQKVASSERRPGHARAAWEPESGGQLTNFMQEADSEVQLSSREGDAARMGRKRHRFLKKMEVSKRSSADLCWARSEEQLYSLDLPGMPRPSETFLQRVEEYSQHHRSCTLGVQNWTALILGEEVVAAAEGAAANESPRSTGQSDSDTCQFLLVDVSSVGLGNRLQTLVAAFAYALVTNRVLLTVDWATTVMLCNPFLDSPWYLSVEHAIFAKRLENVGSTNLCQDEATWQAHTAAFVLNGRIPHAAVTLHHKATQVDQNFFCDLAQQRLRSVTWLTITSEQYFIPGLFLIPSFRAPLEQLFPALAPFTHVARHLLLPSNDLWDRITRLRALHLRHADRRVGVQVRTFKHDDSYAHKLVLDCLVNISQAVPPPIPAQEGSVRNRMQVRWGGGAEAEAEGKVAGAPEQVLLFVSSLHDHHAAYLRDVYTRGVATGGTQVSVHSYPGEGLEGHSLEQDKQALTEIWLLALCETMLASHFSTFGYVAAGLAGRRPYLMNLVQSGAVTIAPPMEVNGRPVCERSVSAEPCFHSPPHNRTCTAAGEGGSARAEADRPPYIQSCQDAEFGYRISSGFL